jgi:hypothetical protein
MSASRALIVSELIGLSLSLRLSIFRREHA